MPCYRSRTPFQFIKRLASLPLLLPTVAMGDAWLGKDKAKHFTVSALIGAAAYTLTDDRDAAFAITLAPGLVKEMIDSTKEYNHFSAKDMAWNAFGAAVGVHLGYLTVTPSKISFRVPF